MRVIDIINQLQLKDIDIQYRFIYGNGDGLLGYAHYKDNELINFENQNYTFSLLTPVVQYAMAKCPDVWESTNPQYLIVWVHLADMSE